MTDINPFGHDFIFPASDDDKTELEQLRREVAKLRSENSELKAKVLPEVPSEDQMPQTWRRNDGYMMSMLQRREGTCYYVEHLREAFVKYKLYKIPTGCNVHHIDRDRENNAHNNLILLRREDHMKLHTWLRADPRREALYILDQLKEVGITKYGHELAREANPTKF